MRRTPPPLSGGAIAAGHPETVRVGADVLAAGGNAVDACVAAGIASWIAEPTVAGPGGGGFMLVHDPRRRSAVAYDFFTAVPGLGATGRPIAPLEELRVEFGTTTQLFLVGPGLVCRTGSRRRGVRGASARGPAAMGRAGAACDPARPHGRHAQSRAGRPACDPRPAPAAPTGRGRGLRARGQDARRGRHRCETCASPTTLERYAEHGAAEFSTGETARVIAESQAAEGGPLTAPRPCAPTA